MAQSVWSVALHGGAGARPAHASRAELERIRRALSDALDAAVEILASAGRSLDAVQCAVGLLERSGEFNAGRGAVLTQAGCVEVDAAIMDGEYRRAGAVAAVRHLPNPIDVARAVLEDGRHVLLAGEGAERFAEAHGFALVSDDELVTARRRRELEAVQAAVAGTRPASPWRPQGTVGAVARDIHGTLAAATSTGGLTNKLPGRVGDSPLLGAGTLAEAGLCAISATGDGESFMRYGAASDVSARMKYAGASLEAAARAVVAEIAAGGGYGGLIAVDRHGALAMPFRAQGMLRAWARSSGRRAVRVET